MECIISACNYVSAEYAIEIFTELRISCIILNWGKLYQSLGWFLIVDKMAAISQAIFLGAFSSMKIYVFLLKFH